MNAPNGGMSPTSNPTQLTVKREYTGMNSYHSTDQTTNQLTKHYALSQLDVLKKNYIHFGQKSCISEQKNAHRPLKGRLRMSDE